MFEIAEHIYQSNIPVQYVFKSGNAKYLVVAFSAFSASDAKIQKAYNHIRTLDDIDCNRLYILDSLGPRGSYYLGEKLNFEFETAVQSLINHFLNIYDISPKNVICIGSSKGGSAALYYAVKYNYGHVIAGAPQTRIGSYVATHCKATADFMIGDDPEGERQAKLDNLIYNLFDKPVVTDMHIFTSENDEQFDSEIKPLTELFKEKNIPCSMHINNDMIGHGAIARFYPLFLRDKVQQIITNIADIKANIKSDREKVTVHADIEYLREPSPDKITYSYIFKSAETEQTFDSEHNEFTFIPEHMGQYTCEVAVHSSLAPVHKQTVGKVTIDKRKFELLGYEFTAKNGNLHFSLKIKAKERLLYAYYLLKDGKILYKSDYGKSTKMSYALDGKGEYTVKYFIRSAEGGRIILDSEPLIYEG
ncbi:MAG: hypothetical protein IJZ35_08520 [Clostridia bacterium]|nr:hypothetical protein [Clostridia bacterium]